MSVLHRHETEDELLAKVIHLAHLKGWRLVHFRPAMVRSGHWATHGQGDVTGWPDIFAVRGHRSLALELKSERGRVTEAQRDWLEDLARAGVECHVVRPSCWEVIVRLLS